MSPLYGRTSPAFCDQCARARKGAFRAPHLSQERTLKQKLDLLDQIDSSYAEGEKKILFLL